MSLKEMLEYGFRNLECSYRESLLSCKSWAEVVKVARKLDDKHNHDMKKTVKPADIGRKNTPAKTLIINP